MDPDAPQSDSTDPATQSIETPPDPARAADDDQPSPPDDTTDSPIEPVPVSAAPPSVNEAGVDSDLSDATIDPPVGTPISTVPSSPAPAVNTPAGGAHLFDGATLGRLGLAARRQSRQAKLERLLAHAALKGHLNVIDVRLLLDIPQRTAEEYLDALIASGHLERRGQKSKTEYWFVG